MMNVDNVPWCEKRSLSLKNGFALRTLRLRCKNASLKMRASPELDSFGGLV